MPAEVHLRYGHLSAVSNPSRIPQQLCLEEFSLPRRVRTFFKKVLAVGLSISGGVLRKSIISRPIRPSRRIQAMERNCFFLEV